MKYKQIVQDLQRYNNAPTLTSHNVVCSFSFLSGLLLLSKKTGDVGCAEELSGVSASFFLCSLFEFAVDRVKQ